MYNIYLYMHTYYFVFAICIDTHTYLAYRVKQLQHVGGEGARSRMQTVEKTSNFCIFEYFAIAVFPCGIGGSFVQEQEHV